MDYKYHFFLQTGIIFTVLQQHNIFMVKTLWAQLSYIKKKLAKRTLYISIRTDSQEHRICEQNLPKTWTLFVITLESYRIKQPTLLDYNKQTCSSSCKIFCLAMFVHGWKKNPFRGFRIIFMEKNFCENFILIHTVNKLF